VGVLFQGAMKVNEVKQVEEVVNKMADKNGVVFDMNVNLAVAKAIQGLRAVFDEVCDKAMDCILKVSF
jgi:alanyl-tRNA synthetase